MAEPGNNGEDEPANSTLASLARIDLHLALTGDRFDRGVQALFGRIETWQSRQTRMLEATADAAAKQTAAFESQQALVQTLAVRQAELGRRLDALSRQMINWARGAQIP